MTALDKQLEYSDGRSAAAESSGRTLHDAARDMLAHPLALESENEAAQMLRAMGIPDPTGADGVLLGQYLKALQGDTSAAKYVRDAALDVPEEPEAAPEPVARLDLTAMTDDELYALSAGEDAP